MDPGLLHPVVPCRFARKGVAGHDQAAAVILSHFPREVREGGADVLITPLVPFAPRGRSAEGRRDGRALGGSVREAGAQVVLVAEFVAPHGFRVAIAADDLADVPAHERACPAVRLSPRAHRLAYHVRHRGGVPEEAEDEPDIVPSCRFDNGVHPVEVRSGILLVERIVARPEAAAFYPRERDSRLLESRESCLVAGIALWRERAGERVEVVDANSPPGPGRPNELAVASNNRPVFTVCQCARGGKQERADQDHRIGQQPAGSHRRTGKRSGFDAPSNSTTTESPATVTRFAPVVPAGTGVMNAP